MAGPSDTLTRRGLLASGAMLGAGVFAGCVGPSGTPRAVTTATAVGAAAPTSPTSARAAAAPGVSSQAAGTLRIMRGSTGNNAFWDRTAVSFKDKTGITVDQTITTGTVEDGTVPTALKSGAGPDTLIVNAGPARVGFLAQTGLIRPLNPHRPAGDSPVHQQTGCHVLHRHVRDSEPDRRQDGSGDGRHVRDAQD